MKILKSVLSEKQEYLLVNSPDINIGVTTNKFGDAKSTVPDFKEKIKKLKEVMQVEHAYSLVPFHSNLIVSSTLINSDQRSRCDGLMMRDDVGNMITVLHASWTTCHKSIVRDGFRLMRNSFVSTDQIRAFIYPGISGKHYEVGRDVHEKLCLNGLEASFTPYNGHSFLLDLANYLELCLLKLGLSHDNISTIDLCSYSSKFPQSENFLLYSHRRQEKERNLIFCKLPGSSAMVTCSTGDCPCLVLYYIA